MYVEAVREKKFRCDSTVYAKPLERSTPKEKFGSVPARKGDEHGRLNALEARY
jgi:hypothetical protein